MLLRVALGAAASLRRHERGDGQNGQHSPALHPEKENRQDETLISISIFFRVQTGFQKKKKG